ncbi:hypothetical protein [Bacillus taeanensis]|uniref:hypothetical protein n=1 Tax=Bacillus taeanensis TaxID=273032 RepID=UPI0015F01CE4|nr:hypothetical protein [Bacillus taeanensis]
MYYIMFSNTEEVILDNIHEVTEKLLEGWKLYGYSADERLSHSLLHECKHY